MWECVLLSLEVTVESLSYRQGLEIKNFNIEDFIKIWEIILLNYQNKNSFLIFCAKTTLLF